MDNQYFGDDFLHGDHILPGYHKPQGIRGPADRTVTLHSLDPIDDGQCGIDLSCDIDKHSAELDLVVLHQAMKEYGAYQLDRIELIGETDLKALTAPDFHLANFEMDISFNPLKVIKSVIKNLYQIRIREKFTG